MVYAMNDCWYEYEFHYRGSFSIYTDYISTADTIMWLAQRQWNSPSGLNDMDKYLHYHLI